MYLCPNMVTENLEYGTDTEYDVVQLLVALDLKVTHQPVDYDNMTKMIQYKVPYIINKSFLLILSFTLGNNIILRIVLGISCLLTMGAVVGLAKSKLIC